MFKGKNKYICKKMSIFKDKFLIKWMLIYKDGEGIYIFFII